MNPGNAHSRWALRAALLVALLAVSAAGWQVAQARADGGLSPHGPGAGRMQGGPLGLDLSPRLLDELGATAEQRSRIHDILKAAREDLAPQRDAHAALRDQTLALLTRPVLDPAAAEALRQQMLAEHDRRSQRMMQAMLEAAAVLTPEQRAQLGSRLQARRELMQRHRSERDALEQRLR